MWWVHAWTIQASKWRFRHSNGQILPDTNYDQEGVESRLVICVSIFYITTFAEFSAALIIIVGDQGASGSEFRCPL
jgi:hypothetical protein